MKDQVTLRSGTRLHILVPWNSIQGAHAFASLLKKGATGVRAQNAPAVFLPINRG